MDEARILPPLVRGKVTGELEFYVDKIKLFRNIFLLTDNFDLILQVQWWGESLPAQIRPKVLQIQGRIIKPHSLKSYHHSVKYKIKTTVDLFESYFKACEVVELSVLETIKNSIVGSAFLRDLYCLLKSNSNLTTLPVYDYLGEEIGEVTFHVDFLQSPQQNHEESLSKISEISRSDENQGVKKEMQECASRSSSKPNYFSLGEKIIYYNGCSKGRSGKEVLIKEYESPITIQKKSANFGLNSSVSETFTPMVNRQEIIFNNKPVPEKQKSFYDGLPELKTSNDSSKVLNFGLSHKSHRLKTEIENSKIKISNKFDSNSIKSKSKPKTSEKLGSSSSSQSSQNKKIGSKSSEKSENFSVKQSKEKKEKDIDHRIFLSNYSSSLKQTDLESIPYKENVKVLDYLLGSDMSKCDEETALNDFKKMSPSHNLVDSISQLCLASCHNKCNIENNKCKPSASLQRNRLNFDFNNPIEKSYYEKFFLPSDSTGDFEVAEFLNKPQNKFKLSKLKLSEPKCDTNESQTSESKNYCNSSEVKKETVKTKAEDYLTNSFNIPKNTNDCSRCKYYKKLDELDTIIESLKHFEKKMMMHEKDMLENFKENPDALLKRNHQSEYS